MKTLYVLAIASLPCIITAFNQRRLSGNSRSNRIKASRLFMDKKNNKDNNGMKNSRRQFFKTFSLLGATASGGTIMLFPQPSNAGEVGARINKAVTQSDLGISVRKSVVKGAQVIDSLDGKWEKFSDDNGLGSERFKQQPRPIPKEIPDPLPLNSDIAKIVLSKSDEAFLETLVSSGINISNINVDLPSQVQKVDNLVRKSFERSGLDLSKEGTEKEWTAQQFNYYCYIHFKAMCDILIENKLSFNRRKFENALGDKILPLFAPSANDLLVSILSSQSQAKAIDVGLKLTDEVIKNLVSFGFCALAERNKIELEEDRIADWIQDLANIELSIPLDGDVTLSSQLLLQEQGFRIYPSFGRSIITSALQKSMIGTKQSISSDEYYMDTNYSSDPNLFEVKEVLINIVIDST